MKRTIFFVGLLIINLSLFASDPESPRTWTKAHLSGGKRNYLSSVVAKVTAEWEEGPSCLEQFCDFLLRRKKRKVFDWEELSKARSPQKRSKIVLL